MSAILTFIVTYFDIIALLVGFALVCGFIARRLGINIKKDGYQPADLTTSVLEGVGDYKKTMANIEAVIDDVTVNDADTVVKIKELLLSQKIFK